MSCATRYRTQQRHLRTGRAQYADSLFHSVAISRQALYNIVGQHPDLSLRDSTKGCEGLQRGHMSVHNLMHHALIH